MSVYVDALIDYGWRLGPSCHMRADSLDELHEFASMIGLKRAWFQSGNRNNPHYDLTESRRNRAIDIGAIELSRREWVAKFPRRQVA